MMKGLKICGVSDPMTLNFIINHNSRPALTMIGFITNYKVVHAIIIAPQALKNSSHGRLLFNCTVY